MHLLPRHVLLILPMLLTGCVLAPKEAKQEQSRLDEAGKTYSQSFAKRELPKSVLEGELCPRARAAATAQRPHGLDQAREHAHGIARFHRSGADLGPSRVSGRVGSPNACPHPQNSAR